MNNKLTNDNINKNSKNANNIKRINNNKNINKNINDKNANNRRSKNKKNIKNNNNSGNNIDNANANIPIISCFDGSNEITTALGFADHVPEAFKHADSIKQKGIHRAYIVFYDEPKKNKFLKKLKSIFLFHAGSTITSVFEYKKCLIAISPMGGPAAAGLMEELSVFGINEFIAIGSAGCLNENLQDKFILVDKAIRDEGLSYHYLKPATYVSTNETLNHELEQFLQENGFEYNKSTTWTTDAIYRETDKKVAMAKELGAVAVEMECASWCAVAEYRNFKFSQLLYFSDLVKQEGWTRLLKMDKTYKENKKDIILLIVKQMIENYSI